MLSRRRRIGWRCNRDEHAAGDKSSSVSACLLADTEGRVTSLAQKLVELESGVELPRKISSPQWDEGLRGRSGGAAASVRNND